MKRRKYRLPAPSNAAYQSGQVLTFSASDDVHKSPVTTPVELTPVGPAPTIYEFRPEHDLINTTRSASSAMNDSAPRARECAAPYVHRFPEVAFILEYLQSGPKMRHMVRRYLYLMDSEIGATATTEILNVLSEEGLVKLDHKTGEYRLTCRDKSDPSQTRVSA